MWGDAAAALRRRGPAVLAYAVLLFAIVWVAEKAFGKGFGTTGNAPQFVIVALNGVSLAALYFVTASGFTLVFGLMRVVNMAHGALYLLGGYLALDLAQHGWNWWLAAAGAMVITGAVGLLMQQSLLRWNQGQDLRQALITIAVRRRRRSSRPARCPTRSRSGSTTCSTPRSASSSSASRSRSGSCSGSSSGTRASAWSCAPASTTGR